LPRDTGPCSGSYARYYYDPVEGGCRLFMYGGCLGNGNRFNTKAECEDACGTLGEIYDTGTSLTKTSDVVSTQAEKVPPVPAEVFEEMRRIKIMYSERYLVCIFPLAWDFCLQHHTYGTCPRPRLHLTRYFYNRKTKHCEPYFYTGCGARGNHFETKLQCDNVCTRRLRRSSTFNVHFLEAFKTIVSWSTHLHHKTKNNYLVRKTCYSNNFLRL
uniref:BPTI/Kunitz inhibitor domain-containing protein n=1 Tax=Hydatigena taeniaeformis TaxID=6205 RepID=A0A0R3WQW9_HYDTA